MAVDPPFWAKIERSSHGAKQHLWGRDGTPRCMVNKPETVPSKRKFPMDKPPRRACKSCLRFLI